MYVGPTVFSFLSFVIVCVEILYQLSCHFGNKYVKCQFVSVIYVRYCNVVVCYVNLLYILVFIYPFPTNRLHLSCADRTRQNIT